MVVIEYWASNVRLSFPDLLVYIFSGALQLIFVFPIYDSFLENNLRSGKNLACKPCF